MLSMGSGKDSAPVSATAPALLYLLHPCSRPFWIKTLARPWAWAPTVFAGAKTEQRSWPEGRLPGMAAVNTRRLPSNPSMCPLSRCTDAWSRQSGSTLSGSADGRPPQTGCRRRQPFRVEGSRPTPLSACRRQR